MKSTNKNIRVASLQLRTYYYTTLPQEKGDRPVKQQLAAEPLMIPLILMLPQVQGHKILPAISRQNHQKIHQA